MGGHLVRSTQDDQPRLVLVDEQDAWLLSAMKWVCRKLDYVVCHSPGKPILLHRLILNAARGQMVDHIDGNPLNNTRANLRICTHAENMCNRRRAKTNKSGYKGVYRKSNGNGWWGWTAEIRHGGKKRCLGYFDSAEKAHEAYCRAAKELHGDFARFS